MLSVVDGVNVGLDAGKDKEETGKFNGRAYEKLYNG
jgi:hypothetical protein